VPTINNAGQSAGSSTGTITIAAFAVAAGADRIIRLGVGIRNQGSQTVSTATPPTFGNQTFTFFRALNNATNARTEMWYLLNPDVETNDIVVTLTGAIAGVAGASAWNDVDPTTPFENPADATGNTTAPTVAVTSAAGNVVVDALALRSEPTVASVTDPIVQEWNLTQGVGGAAVLGGGAHQPGAASVTMEWALDVTRNWALIGASMRAAPVGFPPPLLSHRRAVSEAPDDQPEIRPARVAVLFPAAAPAFPVELFQRRQGVSAFEDPTALAAPRVAPALFEAAALTAFPPELLARRIAALFQEEIAPGLPSRLSVLFLVPAAAPAFPPELFRRPSFFVAEEQEVEELRRLAPALFEVQAAAFPPELFGRFRFSPAEEIPLLVPLRLNVALFPLAAPAPFPYELLRRPPSPTFEDAPVVVASRLALALFGPLAPAAFPTELFPRRVFAPPDEPTTPEVRRLFHALFAAPAAPGFPPELLARLRFVPVEEAPSAMAARPDLALLAFLSPAAFPPQFFRRPPALPSEDAPALVPARFPLALFPFVAPVPFPFELLRPPRPLSPEEAEVRAPFRAFAFLFPAPVTGPTFPAALRFRSFEVDLLRRDVLTILLDLLTVRRSAQSIAGGVKGFAKSAVGAFQGLIMEEGGLLLSSEIGRVAGAQVEILIEEASGLVENDEVSSVDTGETYTVTAAFVMRAPDGSALFRRALGVVKRG
jgi:hypothetical protein